MDDRQKVGEPGRGWVLSTEEYEVRNFAERHGITLDQARELIRRHGARRWDVLDAAAQRLKMH